MLSQIETRDNEQKKYGDKSEELSERRFDLLKTADLAVVEEINEKEQIHDQRRFSLEKERIIQDIHDGVAGIATNIHLLAAIAQEKTSISDIREILVMICELSKEEISEIRNILYGLDERQLDWYSLLADLRHYGKTLIEPHGILFDMNISIENGLKRPSTSLCLGLFRIFKEALINIVKHSGAGRVMVRLDADAEKLSISIQDDGVGLTGNAGRGRGISHMKVRVQGLGGNLAIKSECGTCISLEVPISF
jgi:signal transduction histidine kinase